MIGFNVAPFVGTEFAYMKQAIDNHKICGDGEFTKKCKAWMEEKTGTKEALLTTSCTHALEMAALLCEIQPGDEVIMPSFTFVSTADAFVLRGAKIVFVDVRPDTMNMDEKLIEAAITDKTKAIVPVHYAGVSCEMDTILEIARLHNLYVVEDAAQGIMASYKGRALGSMGEFGCFSFHETKNLSMGEGGALLIREPQFIERAEILREKGTNRSKFFRGEIDKYSWCDMGSSYLPSDMNAAYLWGQFEAAEQITERRMQIWDMYDEAFRGYGKFDVPFIPEECEHNAHMYYLKTRDLDERTRLIAYLLENDIRAVFHYVPLHSSQAGRKFGRFCGEDIYTTKESERLVRLPVYYSMTDDEVGIVIDKVKQFYR